jgi:hypothetical protein
MAMQIEPRIFAVSVILLVPFFYVTSFIPDACAVPPSSGFSTSGTCGAKTTSSDGVSKQTCCWKERTGTSMGPGPEVMKCQTCYQSDIRSPLACNDPVVQSTKVPEDIRPELNSGVQDELPTSPKFGSRLPPITGGIIEEPMISSNNSTNETSP